VSAQRVRRVLYFDCFSGISGDMCLAALVDAGCEAAAVEEALGRLGVGGYELRWGRVSRSGIDACDLTVEVSGPPVSRHLPDILGLIEGAGLPERARDWAAAVFSRLAEAEARVHNTTPDRVHFHEVGAVDAIVDIVGAAVALDRLAVDEIVASPLPLGRGFVRAAHGVLPLPAPATVELLRGFPVHGRDVNLELVTPTGAAILTAVADRFGEVPAMRLVACGYGAGKREQPAPNLLRVLVGEVGG